MRMDVDETGHHVLALDVNDRRVLVGLGRDFLGGNGLDLRSVDDDGRIRKVQVRRNDVCVDDDGLHK